MLTDQEKDLLAQALAVGLEFSEEAPDLDIDFNDRDAVMADCRSIVDGLSDVDARIALERLRAAWNAGRT